jgi:hypothetical protein
VRSQALLVAANCRERIGYASYGGSNVILRGTLLTRIAAYRHEHRARQNLNLLATAGLIAPTFKAEIDSVVGADGKPQKLGIFTKWKKLQIPITAANAFNDYLGLGTSIRDTNAIQSVHLSDANVSDFELLVNENMYRKDTTAGNAANLAARDMSPDPTATNDCPARAMYDIVMDHDDVLENVLPLQVNGTESSINLRLNESGGTVARNISTIVQLIGAAE